MKALKGILLKGKTLFFACPENNYEPKLLKGRFLFWILAIMVSLKLLMVPIFVSFQQNIFFADLSKEMIIQFINEARAEQNIPLLEENSLLDDAATLKAYHMLANGYFAHESPSGVTPWYWFKQAGYEYQAAGENLAIGFFDSEEVYGAWYDSSSHRANILNPKYTETGLAIVKGVFEGRETYVLVQTFALPQAKLTSKPEEEEETIPPLQEEQETEIAGEVTEEPVQEPLQEVAEEEPVEEEKLVAGETEVAQEEPADEIYPMKEAFPFSLVKFMVSSYHSLIQGIIFFSLLFLIILSVINILTGFNIQRKEMVLKTCVLLLFFFGLCQADKQILIQLIPHQLIIS